MEQLDKDQLEKDTVKAREIFSNYPEAEGGGEMFDGLHHATQKMYGLWFGNRNAPEPPLLKVFDESFQKYLTTKREELLKQNGKGGSRRCRPSRKYKKSKRVFRKKSRSMRRR